MRLLAATRQRWLPSLITLFMSASWAASAASAPAIECYRQPRPDTKTKNVDVEPDQDVAARPDPWGSPGAPPITGTFPCAKLAPCDLRAVLDEAHVCALLVIQGGKLVHEYYETANRNCTDTDGENGVGKAFGIASIAKSVVSTVFGHIWSRPERYGAIALTDPVSAYVTGLPPGTHLRDVTLGQALSMTSRLKFDDAVNCLQVWTTEHASEGARGKTFLEAVAAYPDREFWLWPGHPFQYSGLDSTLVGLAIEALSRKAAGPGHLNQILSDLIWTQAGMREQARWKADKAGTPAPFCCFYATARDMGRFGQHVLHNVKARGSGPDAPIHDWMVQPATEQVWLPNRTCRVQGRTVRIGYGYLWWHLGGGEGFTGAGTGGQFLHVFPDQDAVVVQFGSWPRDSWPEATECNVYAAHRFLVDHYTK